MSIYNKSGELLSSAFGNSGAYLSAAYSKSGAQIFPDGPMSLKVMTYNVGGWYDGKGTNVPAAQDQEYFDLQYGTIHDNDPDFLLLEEYWDQFSKAGRTALSFLSELFPYVYSVNGNTKYFGRCFCSKYPLSGYQQRLYAGENERYYDTIIANVKGRNIMLCVTHLGLTSDVRAPQAQELLAFAQTVQIPIIIAGDFNTASSRPDGTDYNNVLLPFLNAGYSLANCGDFGRLITYMDLEYGNGALDNIVCSDDFTITNVYVDTRKATDELSEHIDHMPLIATVEFEL